MPVQLYHYTTHVDVNGDVKLIHLFVVGGCLASENLTALEALQSHRTRLVKQIHQIDKLMDIITIEQTKG